MTIRISFSDKMVRVAVEINGAIESAITELPQRTWVSLTDEEVGDLSDFAYANDEEFVRNVEKYLKEKNNG